ncbi:hypothetical protein A3H10_01800 [Candidatus Uhrbacteria bacterium RIFCSPLOWO2_12_FULL_46_10]|uniref:Response regulatory domain-containing protein n=1 Tax=Candidatus Uhrbacteria bacterium RIFCSPLOWO2_01_FULL_47_25 TaxID=1802402 RepID=A0A1F7USY5_9BACT|nr:MAG: hypothetical protein A2752_03330 [Candidatus Uhrbacteria bacterium RIFCSPHIGHO2_01_FULL_46_23]OGL69555.1 MAG: hypothetical protein A3D60_00885 [Candidatus Uhrbacteria bacterium RIFCSPHIGHO2_02_FULL_47_29]OGL76024.1 MAG: hypothetical protein A3E96_02105 [Candidatus Uhrbacteria bacterium RIFCSPHIGHO2_12_FULL_46_13]OGL81402.1 MAG: hypothetical protein A2936_00205 [Candidatus Uhrbacteria bacterium RIFCSPLOWO2_01_FULL_47_25]OGL86111.1 MAG: hypothetical protein A3I37_00075 [Candidatus Uhrbact
MSKLSKTKPTKTKVKDKTILIIEDDRFVSGMYADKLISVGFKVHSAFDGEAGLNLALANHPDIILLDVMLPIIDGFEVLRRLKSNKELASVPVIILSNLGDPEQVKTGLKLGASDYMIKAYFVPSEVLAHIQALVK